MDIHLVAYICFLTSYISFTCCNCPEYIFRMIESKNQLVDNFQNVLDDLSVNECGEMCVDTINCDSFSYLYNNTPTKCYIYNNRVWSGQSVTLVDGLVTYWRLKDRCPGDYIYNKTYNVCFKPYINDYGRKNWADALKHCQDDGGYLYIANTIEKWQILDKAIDLSMGTVPEWTFIGANDLIEEGKWEWIDGTNVTFWKAGEPNNLGGEDCAVFRTYYPERLALDYSCSAKMSFICEIAIIPSFT